MIVITPSGLRAQNSASDLARQLVTRQSDVVDVATRRRRAAPAQHLLGFLLRLVWKRLASPTRGQIETEIYYQLSNPLAICGVALLGIVTKGSLTVHLLDNFLETKKYRRYGGISKKIALILLRRADRVLSISAVMQSDLRRMYGIASDVSFRWRPVVVQRRVVERNGKIVFGGAINDKTNFAALQKFVLASEFVNSRYHLDVFARGGNKLIASAPNVSLHDPIPEDEFIKLATTYDAFLVPFNFDQQSLNFYRGSCPSKSSSLFAAGRPLLLFGPKEFWFIDFLDQFAFSCDSLSEIEKTQNVGPDEYVRANEQLGKMCGVLHL